jgi:hypothetical protein
MTSPASPEHSHRWTLRPCGLVALVLALAAPACSDKDGPADPSPDGGGDSRPSPDLFVYRDGAAALGAACSDEAPCASGLTCDAVAGRCTKPCEKDEDCGGLVCAEESAKGATERLCRRPCDPRLLVDPCAEGLVCQVQGSQAVCVTDCRSRGCDDAGWICDSGSGLCVDPQGGSVGAPCGPALGDCAGTPNGVCIAVDNTRPGLCTLPCSPFAKPCPLALPSAICGFGSNEAPYCGFLCDPQSPSCPHPDLECVTVGKDFHVCLPQP